MRERSLMEHKQTIAYGITSVIHRVQMGYRL